MKDQEQNEKKRYKRKGKRKEILFKDDEWDIVVKNATQMKLSTSKYIVKMSLDGKTSTQDISDITELSCQLSRIGNNLNQLARKANEINCIYAEDYRQMKEEYSRLCRILNQKISTLHRTVA